MLATGYLIFGHLPKCTFHVATAIQDTDDGYDSPVGIRDIEDNEVIHRHCSEATGTPWFQIINLEALGHLKKGRNPVFQPF